MEEPRATAAAVATPASSSSPPAKAAVEDLQVEFGTPPAEKSPSSGSSPGVGLEDTTPVSLASPGSPMTMGTLGSPLPGASSSRNALDFDDDSDDDLL